MSIASGDAVADPVHGETFSYVQPDGSIVEVRLWGDEFYHIVESMDGYTLVRDQETKAACYAELSADGIRGGRIAWAR